MKKENDILKQAALILAKIALIKASRYKYSISAMCKLLEVTRSLVYYNPTPHKIDPNIKTLQIEYARLEAERKKLWSGHKAEREEMVELKMALQNVRLFFAEPREQKIVRANDTR